MAIITDKEAHEGLKKTVGSRLRAARRAAGVTEGEAAEAIGHKGLTQLSLAESGQRLPPLHSLVTLADLYSVPIDFLLGRIDDPIAEADEHSQGLIARAVGQSIHDCFGMFAKSIAQQASVAINNHRVDRQDLRVCIDAAQEALDALKRVKELNPEFDEEWRGGAKLEAAIMRIVSISEPLAKRIDFERRQLEVVEKTICLEEAEKRICQFQLELTTT